MAVDSGISGVQQEGFTVHGGGTPVGGVSSGPHPVEVAGERGIQPGRDIVALWGKRRFGVTADDWLGEHIGRRGAQGLIDIGKMLAIQLIEFPVVGGVMFGAIPPVPVTTFGDQEFFIGQIPLFRRGLLRIFAEEIPGCA